MDQNKPRSFSQRFSESRPTKTAVFWACAGCIVATLIVGTQDATSAFSRARQST